MKRHRKRTAIAGVDEAGRGPLAGPVVAAAVILPWRCALVLADSKTLAANRRETLAQAIRAEALACSVAVASAAEIDALNIHRASLLAMSRALRELSPQPDLIMVDGLSVPRTPLPCRAVTDGDANWPQISAASILAKVVRDAIMCDLERRYPGYGFARHKGYGTALHRAALAAHGPCAEHRRSFAPVRLAMA